VNEPSRELKGALAGVLQAGDGDPEDHPAADELAAYHAGELAEAEEARVRSHLLACGECTGLLLDLDALQNDPAFGADRPAPAAEIEAVWRAVQPHVPARAAAPTASPDLAAPALDRPATLTAPAPPTGREVARRPRQAPWLQALAAALLVAVVGLSFWVLRLRTDLGALSRPQLNAPVQDLTPGGARGGEGGPLELRLPPHTGLFTLVLNPASPRDFPAYAVDIAPAEGSVLWSGEGLEKNAYGSFSLALPRSLMPDGRYTIRLYGVTGARREPLGDYDLILAAK
jgi:hypothetical protein